MLYEIKIYNFLMSYHTHQKLPYIYLCMYVSYTCNLKKKKEKYLTLTKHPISIFLGAQFVLNKNVITDLLLLIII